MPVLTLDEHTISVDTSSAARRALFSLLALGLAFPIVYHSYGIFFADRIIMSEKTFAGYSRAIEYDPSNCDLWWQRGRMSHYSLENANLAQAIEDYRKSLSLNPRLAQAWADLADCYERLGRFPEAERALESACATRTYSPIIRWQSGNYYLRRGNLARMYENFRIAAESDAERLPLAMELSWRVDRDHTQVLRRLIPDLIQTNLLFLDFTVARGELELAQAAWERVLKNQVPSDFEFKVSAAFGYIDRLLGEGRVSDALRVWDESLAKSGTLLRETRFLTPSGQTGPPGQSVNLAWNGSFESELLGGGFDWRYKETREIQFEADPNTYVEGARSLHITFTGSNDAMSHLTQIVPIPGPGTYSMEFSFRTDGLTSDQTPYFEIQGYPDASGAKLRTPMFPSAPLWRKAAATFVVMPDCGAVQLTLRRDPSSGSGHTLKGSLWLDGMEIRRRAEMEPK